MDFSKAIDRVREVVLAIDNYDDKVVQVLSPLSQLLPEKYKKVLDFIMKYEPSLLVFLLNVIGKSEKTNRSGEEKLKAAMAVVKQIPDSFEKKYRDIGFKEAIAETVSIINLFAKE